MMPAYLNCLSLDDNITEHNVVKINLPKDTDTTVLNLKELITVELHAASPLLMIWKVFLPLDNGLADKIARLTFRYEDQLPPMQQLLELFKDALPDELHIVVRSCPMRSVKRPRASSDVTVLERLKHTKLVKIAPSQVARPSVYENFQQQSEERILDDRPKPDADIPPISLLYGGFGQFLDIVDGRSDVEGLSEVGAIEIRKRVDDFAAIMCRCFENEDTKRKEGLPLLNKIFAARKGRGLPELRADSNGAVRTGGHYNVGHGAAIMISLFRNRTGNSTVPEVEIVGYFAHSHAKGMAVHKEEFEGWRVPCLGLTIVGPDIKFYAILNLGHQYRLVGLTPALSCFASASDGRDRKALYAAFTAASVLQARMLQDAHDRLFLAVSHIQDDVRLPPITKLRRYPNVQGKPDDFLTFHILLRHPDIQSYRLLYFAGKETGEVILVKFVRQYSTDLHAFCADSGHAPRLLAFQRLPGGWYGLAMEYIPDAVPIMASSHLAENFERWKIELQHLVESFHNRGLVHGDLRDANLICGDDGHVNLIDFDWGGMDGEVSYPTPNLHPELLEVRSSVGLKITKDNDLRILKNTLAKIESGG